MVCMVHDRQTMIADVTRNVPGALSADACRVLYNLVEESLPKDGVILDLNCGHGRSTIIAAKALGMTEKTEAQILAVDTHITDPNSVTPHKDGSLLPFLQYLRMFKVSSRVYPLIAPTSTVSRLLNKKCANMVIVQLGEHNLLPLVRDAQFAIRKGGKIIVFSGLVMDDLFPEADYKKTTNVSGIQVWTAVGAKEK